MSYLPGKSAKLTFGVGSAAVELSVKKIGWKLVVDDLDTTSTTSGGHREFISGLDHLEISIDADWDATTHPGVTPIDVQTNAILSNFSYYDNRANTLATLTCAAVKVNSVDVDSPVEGTINWKISAKSTGAYTLNVI